MATILVTGGAGYIGSMVTRHLVRKGHAVVVFDDLSTGHREAVDTTLVQGSLGSDRDVKAVFEAHRFDGVMHFASHCYVGESVTNPRKYFEDNLGNGMRLLGAMLDHGVRSFVFSSTCATYGVPDKVPMAEDTPQHPINPYGETKLYIERMMARYGDAYGLRSTALRYFNACGAALDGSVGESHDPETHLIPLALSAALPGEAKLSLFGEDYPTPDGTCVRDYIHIEDLATAHVAAMQRMLDGAGSAAFNLGTGNGYSVKQIVDAVERVTGRTVRRTVGPRRPGDPPSLVADARLANRELGWTPTCSDLDTIVSTAWKWAQKPRF